MNRLTIESAEALATHFRSSLCVANCTALNMKTLLRQLNVITMYRPLSESLWGLSMKDPSCKAMFMLVNSNSTRGRQHFTIAHELFHLFYDENPSPHFSGSANQADANERSANLFASALLMPREGICQYIPADEIMSRNISVETALRLEYIFGVSHSTLVLRLKELKLVTKECEDALMKMTITREAALRGYDASMYQPGNEGLVIGDFGSIAKRLYDNERISEGHYLNLLSMIGYGASESGVGC